MAQAEQNPILPDVFRERLTAEIAPLVAAGDVGPLVCAYECFVHASDAINGYINQPKCGERGPIYDLLAAEYDRMCMLADAVIEALRAMTFVSDKDQHAHALVDWAFRTGESLEKTMVVLAQAAAMREAKPH